MTLKGILFAIGLSCVSIAVYAANVDQVVKEETAPPAAEGAITTEQIPPLYTPNASPAAPTATQPPQNSNQPMPATTTPTPTMPQNAAPMQQPQQPMMQPQQPMMQQQQAAPQNMAPTQPSQQ